MVLVQNILEGLAQKASESHRVDAWWEELPCQGRISMEPCYREFLFLF